MQGLIDEFNEHFDGDAEITVEGKNLLVTVGSRTMVIRLPGVIGFQAKAEE